MALKEEGTGQEEGDRFIDLPLSEDEAVKDETVASESETGHTTEQDQSSSSYTITNGHKPTVSIVEASKSTETHSHRSYIVYTIKIGNDALMVKRRYSEFEILRECLVKLFPTKVIPPIPEKQSLKSSLSATTSSSITGVIGGPEVTGLHSEPSYSSQNYIEYRKRMLGVFLNRCMQIEEISNNFLFNSFLDPKQNFNEYLSSKVGSSLTKTSIYRLSPFKPLENLENQLYLTLPNPNTVATAATAIVANGATSTPAVMNNHYLSQNDELQHEQLIKFEEKFNQYEAVLSNITRVNKKVVKHLRELSADLTEISSQFNTLSLMQDSNFIEDVGRAFGHSYVSVENLAELINLEFLQRMVELKNFTKAAMDLIDYNKKKVMQLGSIEKSLKHKQNDIADIEAREAEIRRIEQTANGISGLSTQPMAPTEPTPITDQDLQASLASARNKSYLGKIPGFKKVTSVIQSMTEQNTEETRRREAHELRIRVYQLQRQCEMVKRDDEQINREVIKELTQFHGWFKQQLSELMAHYSGFLQEFFKKNTEVWEDMQQ